LLDWKSYCDREYELEKHIFLLREMKSIIFLKTGGNFSSMQNKIIFFLAEWQNCFNKAA
jgi:hypothetical protein